MLPPSFLGDRTILAIAGEDFSVIAADTRLSQGFSIHTRDSPKTYKLWVKTFLVYITCMPGLTENSTIILFIYENRSGSL